MSARPIPLSIVGVIVLCMIAVCGYVYWARHAQLYTKPGPSSAKTNLVFDADQNSRGSNSLSSPALSWPALPAVADAKLAWSPMAELQQPAVRDRTRVDVTRAFVAAPLDLALPADIASDVDLDKQSVVLSSGNGGASSPTLTADLNPNVDERVDESDNSTHLFNRNNGLRGFMAQNWLNKRVGFQGGLAIKEERLRGEHSDLRDNMAVGMGLLLSF